MAWGFVAVGAAFLALAIVWDAAQSAHGAELVLLMLTQAALMWGCQFATYLYPQVVFPLEIRSTFHGLSAFSGKCGAVLGTYAFRPITHAYGHSESEKHNGYVTVMFVQVGIAAAGLLATLFLLQRPPTDSNSNDTAPVRLIGSARRSTRRLRIPPHVLRVWRRELRRSRLEEKANRFQCSP